MFLELDMNNIAIVITARLASTRIPGKVFLHGNESYLLMRLMEQVVDAFADDFPLYITSESEHVLQHFAHERITPILTGKEVRSGSERVAQLSRDVVADKYLLIPCDIWLDSPSVMVEFLADCLRRQCECATLAKPFTNPLAFSDAANVKVLHDLQHDAIFFARNLPFPLEYYGSSVAQQLGLYFYSRNALTSFLQSPPVALERNEENESFRFLMNGWRMYCSITERNVFSLNTHEDVQKLSLATGMKLELRPK